MIDGKLGLSLADIEPGLSFITSDVDQKDLADRIFEIIENGGLFLKIVP